MVKDRTLLHFCRTNTYYRGIVRILIAHRVHRFRWTNGGKPTIQWTTARGTGGPRTVTWATTIWRCTRNRTNGCRGAASGTSTKPTPAVKPASARTGTMQGYRDRSAGCTRPRVDRKLKHRYYLYIYKRKKKIIIIHIQQ